MARRPNCVRIRDEVAEAGENDGAVNIIWAYRESPRNRSCRRYRQCAFGDRGLAGAPRNSFRTEDEGKIDTCHLLPRSGAFVMPEHPEKEGPQSGSREKPPARPRDPALSESPQADD